MQIMMAWSLLLLPPPGKGSLAIGPNTAAYLKRMAARPAFQRGAERIKAEEKAQRGKAKL